MMVSIRNWGANIHEPNRSGTTPLTKAIEMGHGEAAAMLRQLGASGSAQGR